MKNGTGINKMPIQKLDLTLCAISKQLLKGKPTQ